ncbi:MAG: glycerol-3-phosphate 1-O-acyltransferase PlsY [Clostridia bacterium]|nr:glycerol-3-phosphate 1-O-acyltransferase PlsY [Clostridia bacterium]
MEITYATIRAYGLLGMRFLTKVTEGDQEMYCLPLNFLIIAAIIAAAVSYLLGGLNFAIIISKIKYRDDIRNHGSGNAGMTNMMRTYGRAAGIFTFLGDLMKAVVSVLLTMLLIGETAAYVAAIACMLGHCFPCWYGFKGGKGVAVSAAAILCLQPLVFAIVLIVFIIVVAATRYISLGSIMSALVYPLVLTAFYPYTITIENPLYFVIVTCSIITTLLIIFMHRENISRLLNGKENKFSFKKKGTQNDENINKD